MYSFRSYIWGQQSWNALFTSPFTICTHRWTSWHEQKIEERIETGVSWLVFLKQNHWNCFLNTHLDILVSWNIKNVEIHSMPPVRYCPLFPWMWKHFELESKTGHPYLDPWKIAYESMKTAGSGHLSWNFQALQSTAQCGGFKCYDQGVRLPQECFWCTFLLEDYPLVNEHSWLENPPFWRYLPGKMGIFMGYVSSREGNQISYSKMSEFHCHYCSLPEAVFSIIFLDSGPVDLWIITFKHFQVWWRSLCNLLAQGGSLPMRLYVLMCFSLCSLLFSTYLPCWWSKLNSTFFTVNEVIIDAIAEGNKWQMTIPWRTIIARMTRKLHHATPSRYERGSQWQRAVAMVNKMPGSYGYRFYRLGHQLGWKRRWNIKDLWLLAVCCNPFF